MLCAKCGFSNPNPAQFCLRCHYILIHRCPKCWHEQTAGNICEACGTNIALYWELAFERSQKISERVWWDRAKHYAGIYSQILLLPFTSLEQLLRSLLTRIISRRLFDR